MFYFVSSEREQIAVSLFQQNDLARLDETFSFATNGITCQGNREEPASDLRVGLPCSAQAMGIPQ